MYGVQARVCQQPSKLFHGSGDRAELWNSAIECRIAKENLFRGRVEASAQVQNRKSMKLAMPFLKAVVAEQTRQTQQLPDQYLAD